MLDVLYVVSGLHTDQCLFKRFKCSVDSVLANDCQEFNIGVCDTSPVSIRAELERHLNCEFNYLYRKKSGDYNKSFNINLAVKELSTAEHIMVTDLDMVFQRSHISNCFSLVEDYPVITYVTHALESEYYSSNFGELRGRKGTTIPTGGGFFALKDAFSRLNGFDEAYYGWGAEDSDFYNRAQRLYRILRPCEDIKVAHLWHRPNDRNRKVNEMRNNLRYTQRTELIAGQQVEPWDIHSSLRDPASVADSQ